LEIGGGFGGKDMIFLDPVAAFLSKKLAGMSKWPCREPRFCERQAHRQHLI